jgi:demethylmenaquinone methyltransferase/2-methoxy-6-polyprenyl-1,4-benzoquinol methylase
MSQPTKPAIEHSVARQLFAALPRRYDLLAELLSFGQNRRWRSAMIKPIVERSPSRVLDVATGTGGVALRMSEQLNTDIVGVDLSMPMLLRAQERITRRGKAHQIRLVVAGAEQLPFPDESFDAVTFTYLLRYVADPAATLRELVRVLRSGGEIASLEFAVPSHPLWHASWVGYTRAVLPVAGLLSGGVPWLRVGRFLGPSITSHYRRYPLSWHRQAWRDAGLQDVHLRTMSLGGGVVMWGRKDDH